MANVRLGAAAAAREHSPEVFLVELTEAGLDGLRAMGSRQDFLN